MPHHGTLIKVAPDGSSSEVVCNGFRAANGVGIGPHGELATSDQEGHWTPANRINIVEPGGFYGNVWSYHEGPDPTSYEPPLCWLPKNVDRSPAEQLWVTSDRWGPLRGSLLSTSYGTGQLFLVPYERVAGRWQGGATRFPLDFPTGVMRARFSPRDGQLYACGLFGWSSNKTKPGGFFRIRYTGLPVRLPKALRATKSGLLLTFTEPLDRAAAEDAGRWSVERWNYRWTRNYGSKHYSVAQPQREGQDPVPVASARLLEDGKTVFLAIDDMRPVMQMKVAWNIKAADGADMKGELYNTVNALGEAKLNLPAPTPTTPSGGLTEEQKARLRPGLLARFEQRQGGRLVEDTRRSRLAALHVASDAAATPFLRPGPFSVAFHGFVKAELTGDHHFHIYGAGQATLTVNGQEVWRGDGDLSRTPPAAAPLRQGFNRLALRYEAPTTGDAELRLFWSGPAFESERVSPLALACDGADAALAKGDALRAGRQLFATRDCAKCHLLGGAAAAMPEMAHQAPTLEGVGARLSAAWIYHWILDPRSLRSQASMPRLLHGDPPRDKRQAADIAVWLRSLAAKPASAKPAGKQDARQGEILFENLGCISCHTLAPPGEKDAFQRVSLHFVAAKFQPGACANSCGSRTPATPSAACPTSNSPRSRPPLWPNTWAIAPGESSTTRPAWRPPTRSAAGRLSIP